MSNDKNNGLTVGMTLYRDVRYRNDAPVIREYTVTAIGTKYVTVKSDWQEEKINKANLRYEDRTHNQRDFQLYKTPEEILEFREFGKLSGIIRDKLSGYGKLPYTLQQLKDIAAIINNDVKELSYKDNK